MAFAFPVRPTASGRRPLRTSMPLGGRRALVTCVGKLLSLRSMQNRRLTRLTNAFSKKVANLEHSIAITFMHDNFCRVHQTLRLTPAMAAGLTDHVSELDELIALMPKAVARAWGSVKRS